MKELQAFQKIVSNTLFICKLIGSDVENWPHLCMLFTEEKKETASNVFQGIRFSGGSPN